MNCAEQAGLRRGEGLSEQGRVTEPPGDHRPDLLDQAHVLWEPEDHSPQTRVWGSEEGPEAALYLSTEGPTPPPPFLSFLPPYRCPAAEQPWGRAEDK